MIPILIAFAVLFGVGGTVVASDSARPGDLLFPIDRAVEEVRATFTSAEGKAELKVKFAEERLDEIDSILEDESATTTPNGVSQEAQLNLSHALDILAIHLADIHNLASTTPPGILEAISVIEDRLQNRVGSLPQELKIKVRDDRGRIELKTQEGKVKVKIDNDGEIEIKIEDRDDDSDDSSGKGRSGSNSGPGSGKSATSTKSDDDSDDDSPSSNSAFEAEADVFTDTTVVKVEINDQKSTFTTSANTRSAVVAEIVSRHPTLVTADVDAVLDFEIENRASRPDDSDADDSDDSDDSDDDNSGSSDDDEDNNDNSGSGSNSGSSNND